MSLNQEIMQQFLEQRGFGTAPPIATRPIEDLHLKEFAVTHENHSVLARIAELDGVEGAEVFAQPPAGYDQRGISPAMPQWMDSIAQKLMHMYGFEHVRYVGR